MLLALAQWLSQSISGFNVFAYITLRAVLAALTALTISFIAGPSVIRWLAAKKSARPCVRTVRKRIFPNRERRPWAACWF